MAEGFSYDVLAPTSIAYAVFVDKETEKMILEQLERMGMPIEMLDAKSRAAMISAITTMPSVKLDTSDVSILALAREAGATRKITNDTRTRGAEGNSQRSATASLTDSKEHDFVAERSKPNEEVSVIAHQDVVFAKWRSAFKDAIKPLFTAAVANRAMTKEQASEKTIEQAADEMVNAIHTFGVEHPAELDAIVENFGPKSFVGKEMARRRMNQKIGWEVNATSADALNQAAKTLQGYNVSMTNATNVPSGDFWQKQVAASMHQPRTLSNGFCYSY